MAYTTLHNLIPPAIRDKIPAQYVGVLLKDFEMPAALAWWIEDERRRKNPEWILGLLDQLLARGYIMNGDKVVIAGAIRQHVEALKAAEKVSPSVAHDIEEDADAE